ncbi:hypothetical protein V3C99_005107 [Haemonchus contortus]
MIQKAFAVVILTILFAVAVSSLVPNGTHVSFLKNEELSKYKPIRKMEFSQDQMKYLEENHIPKDMWPFLNATAVEELYGKRNDSDIDVITDEDVADVSDDGDHPIPNTMHYDGQKTTITISEEGGEMLLQHWLDQSISGLMSAVATKKLATVGRFERAAHKRCTKKASSVKEHAQCVVMLMESEAKYQQRKQKFEAKESRTGAPKVKSGSVRYAVGSPLLASAKRKTFKKKFRNKLGFKDERYAYGAQLKDIETLASAESKWVGSFRMRAKRSVTEKTSSKMIPVNKERYDLLDSHQYSPLATIAKSLLRQVRRLKKKDEDGAQYWKDTVTELQVEAEKLKKKRKFEQMLHKRLDLARKAMRDRSTSRTAMKKMNIFGDYDNDNEVDDVMKKAWKKEQDTKYNEELMEMPVNLVREAAKLTYMLDGRNSTDLDNKVFEILSPRLLPILPEERKDDKIKLLSPSLFPLYDRDRGFKNETSLTNAASAIGEKENDAVLNLIMEASGVSDILSIMKGEDNTNEIRLKDDALRGPNGQPLYFTKDNVTAMFGKEEALKVELFERLQRSLTSEQLMAMNTTGYTIMNAKQLEMVYGPESPHNDSKTLSLLSKVRPEEVPAIIEKTIRGLASETVRFKTQRRKQSITLAPIVLGSIILNPAGASIPIILSPVLLTPLILSPAILGVVLLSPWLFVPIILSPRLLFPAVISPTALSPIILSPFALDPFVLSPGTLLPFVLSPLLLNPFIVSPVALVPLVLTPFCLSPFIGVPNTLAPFVLSPFVLSPIIRSPPFISAFLLSPYALSPSIESDGKCFVSILSPSWLS